MADIEEEILLQANLFLLLILYGSIFCDRLRSSAITIAGSQAIAEVCFHMIADDRRTFCDPRSSAISMVKGDGKRPNGFAAWHVL